MWTLYNSVDENLHKNVGSSYGEKLWINVENSGGVLHREKRGFSAV